MRGCWPWSVLWQRPGGEALRRGKAHRPASGWAGGVARPSARARDAAGNLCCFMGVRVRLGQRRHCQSWRFRETERGKRRRVKGACPGGRWVRGLCLRSAGIATGTSAAAEVRAGRATVARKPASLAAVAGRRVLKRQRPAQAGFGGGMREGAKASRSRSARVKSLRPGGLAKAAFVGKARCLAGLWWRGGGWDCSSGRE